MRTLINNALIVNEGESRKGAVVLDGEWIVDVVWADEDRYRDLPRMVDEVHEADGLWLMPGCIDDQVHFREPGLEHKATIESESRAAIAGGVTSFMEMPNTNPTTTTREAWEDKMERASKTSWANYSFFFGGTNDNVDEIKRMHSCEIPGLKLFLGSSTGNMLVDRKATLERIFGECDFLIATHCESEEIIRRNKQYFMQKFGKEHLDVQFHPLIRSHEACYRSSAFAAELAAKCNARLHILHLSTAREMQLFRNDLPLEEKRITAEACVHHLWFTDADYARLGNRIKWNPAIKWASDRAALREALIDGRIDVVATDHAPHLLSEKDGDCLHAASGGPLVQYSLLVMLELAGQGLWSKEFVVEKMAHAPAKLFRVEKRGFIRKGCYADIVLVDPRKSHGVTKAGVISKCGWSPFEGETFSHSIEATYLNGKRVYSQGVLCQAKPDARALEFNKNN